MPVRGPGAYGYGRYGYGYGIGYGTDEDDSRVKPEKRSAKLGILRRSER